MIKFTTQYTFDYKNSDKHSHSDEVVTIPDESFTVRELLMRSQNNTLPPLSQNRDYDDDTITFDDELSFMEVSDLHDVYQMKSIIENHIYRLEHEKKKTELKEQTKKDENLAPPTSPPIEPPIEE